MANPTIQVTYDKNSYAPGDPKIATVVVTDADTRVDTEVWGVTDGQGNQGTMTKSINIVDPLTVNPPAGWTKTSVGNGSPQTWQGTA